MSIYKKHIENMRLFYLVAMETDLDSCISCFLCENCHVFAYFEVLIGKINRLTLFFMETFF